MLGFSVAEPKYFWSAANNVTLCDAGAFPFIFPLSTHSPFHAQTILATNLAKECC